MTEKKHGPIEQREIVIMWKLLLLTVCLFAAINFFLIPNFPGVQQYIGPVNVLGALGLAAILVIVGTVLGKK